ncbi:hypothetical protein O181_065416 [Austropuccinia psidii MF-1]|uniref:Reverse transcriptase/retrotransposon-derived protein RNase H-like domain-containing protein n=1 Tax=Austropuccinia psidii MF-1 TaxID=1389203 RepID=A0A9Q3I175_9BASI|nr:hypothetical protein [Austropuccinia psidii MF-1]
MVVTGIDKNKVAAVLLKPIPQNKKEMISFLGFSSYYRQHLSDLSILAKSLYGICDQQTVFEMTQERIGAYQNIRKALQEVPLLLMPDWNINFKFYIDACGDGLGAALHQVQFLITNLQRDHFVKSQDKSNKQEPDMVQARCSAYVCRWALANTPDNPPYVPLEEEPQIPIEGITITDIGTEFFEEVRES